MYICDCESYSVSRSKRRSMRVYLFHCENRLKCDGVKMRLNEWDLCKGRFLRILQPISRNDTVVITTYHITTNSPPTESS